MSCIGCSNDNTSTNYEIISLGSEYNRHLSSVAINIFNSYNNKLFDILDIFSFISNFILNLCNSIFFISKIIELKNSLIEFFRNRIFLIKPDYPLIYLTLSKIDCHVNILKKNYCNIKCCIRYIQCFVIDIQLTNISSLNTHLISKYISKFDKLYKLLKSVESDLNESKPLISKLCNIKQDLDLIILNLGSLTWSFGFIVISYNDRLKPQIDLIQSIKSYIDSISSNFTILEFNFNKLKKLDFFNTFFLQLSNKILYIFLKCCLKSSINNINVELIKERTILDINYLLINLMSRIVIDELIFVMSSLYMYFKIKSEISKVLSILEKCRCYKFYNKKFNNHRSGLTLGDETHVNDNPHVKLHLYNKKYNEDNKYCLCLVVRYILLTNLYVLSRYNEYLCMDLLSCMSRSYKKYSYSMTHNLNVSKLMMLIITTMDKIIRWMNNIYIGDKIHCYCYDINNSFYGYLISITLYLSSLIENIWSMDNHTMTMSIDRLSLMIELYKIHIDRKSTKLNDKLIKEKVSRYDIYIYTIRIILFMLKIDKTTKELTPHKCTCIICTNMKLIKNIKLASSRIPILPKIIQVLEHIQKLVTRCQMIKVYQYFSDVIYKIFEKVQTCDFQDKTINLINQISNIYTSLMKKIMVDIESGIINNCKCDTCINGKITCLCINLIHDLIVTLSLGKGGNECQCLTQPINVKCNPLRIECDCKRCCIICLDYNEIMKCLCCINKCCDKKNPCCLTTNHNCCEHNNNNASNGDQEFSIFECQCKNIFEMIKKCSPNKELLSVCDLKKEFCDKCLNVMSKGVMITVRISKVVSEYINKFNIINKLNLLSDEEKKIEYIKCILILINIDILRITKNNLLNFNSHVSTKIISVTNVETRNWGYDTNYEHDVSNDKGFSKGDQYPNLLSDPRYTF